MLIDHYYPDLYEMMRIVNGSKNGDKKRKEIGEMKLSIDIVLMIIKGLYPIIRPILKDAVNDPDVMWDDYLMEMFDRAFKNIPDPAIDTDEK